MEVAVVVSGGIAETVQVAPLIRAIAAGRGEPLVLACPPAAEEVGRLLPGVGTVLPLPALRDRDGRAWQVWAALRRRRVEMAVVCSDRASVRAAVYAAGIPRRLGCHGGISDRLLTDVVRCGPRDNVGQAWTSLASRLGPEANDISPPLALNPAVAAAAEERLLATGAGDGRLLVAIAPGRGFGEGDDEAWSPERWAHLANHLGARHGAGVILVGDGDDREVADAMRVDLAALAVDLCGELTITGTAAVIARCDLFVSTDTPLLQVAAAVGTPSVGLFAQSDGRRRCWAGPEHRVVQAVPLGESSLDQIRVDDVLAAVEGSG